MGLTIPILCVVMYLSALGYWIIGAVNTAEGVSSATSEGGLLSAVPGATSLRAKVALSLTFFSLNVRILAEVLE